MVRGMRGVGGVCEMGDERGEWVRGLGLGFTIPLGARGVLDVYLCLGCRGVGSVGGQWVGGLDQGLE